MVLGGAPIPGIDFSGFKATLLDGSALGNRIFRRENGDSGFI
jgi:hypothetical protein